MRHDSEVQGGGKVAVRGEEAKPSNIQPEQERCWHNWRRKNFIIVIGICPYLTKSLRWNWRIERTRTGVGCQKRWPIRTLEWTKWCTICYTTERSWGHTFELCNQLCQSYGPMIGWLLKFSSYLILLGNFGWNKYHVQRASQQFKEKETVFKLFFYKPRIVL